MSWHMRLLKNLASLRLTVGLLLWLAFLCVLGTVIPQHAPPPGDGAPMAMQVVSLLSLRDVFHSLWFLLPAALLCLNAASCMYLWRSSFGGSSAMPRSGVHEVTVTGTVDRKTIIADIEGFMKDRYRIVRNREDATETILCERGRLRTYAPFVVHLSIVLILVGVGMAFLGYKGSISIPVGRATDVVTLGNGSTIRLPFQVRCDDFTMELYDNGMPKEYLSRISFLRKGTVILKSPVLVNHPVSVGGVLFSQSGYDRHLAADIQVVTPAGTRRFIVAEGSSREMDDTCYRVHAVKVVEDIMGMGPGAHLIIEGAGSQEEVWIFQQFERIKAMHPGITEQMPHFNPSRVNPYVFSLTGVRGEYSTILGVNRDPGVFLVGLGSALFLAGICIAFTVVHERVWISLEEVPQGMTLRVAQRSNATPSAVGPSIIERINGLAGVRS